MSLTTHSSGRAPGPSAPLLALSAAAAQAQTSPAELGAVLIEDIAANPTPMSKLQSSLDFVRLHLGMDVAYLSEFIGDDLHFRALSSEGIELPVGVGDTMPLDQVYCRHICEGRLPRLIRDTSKETICTDLPITQQIPIRSHVSVPIHREDGTVYGMFCCLGSAVREDLTERDLDVMTAFASVSAEQINTHLAQTASYDTQRAAIIDIMENDRFTIAYQPIMDAATCTPRGFEALCRFQTDPYRPPNQWFDDAERVGLQQELEIQVIHKALSVLDDLPTDVYVSINTSPDTVASGALMDALRPYPADRILVEITEHSRVADYDKLLEQIALLRFAGASIAIDDAGAGYSGLQHIVQLRPDVIKLDVSLTSNISTDVVRRSLSAALVSFAREIDAKIVAEGVETGAELETLRRLGVPLAQGYFLGRPQPVDEAMLACAADPTRAA